MNKKIDFKFAQNSKHLYGYLYTNYSTIKKILVSGFLLLVGNLLYLLFFDIGRVLIKILGTEVNFAMYSFSLSMMSTVIIFVNSINKTIYPYMFNYSNKKRGKLTEYLSMLGVASFPLYYGVYYLVLNYIPKYESALVLTAILMSSVPGILVVKSIYANQYKVQKLEKLFVKDTLIYLSICFPMVLFGFYIYESIEAVGLLSVLSIYLWAFNPRKSLSVNFNKVRMLIFLFFNICSYYLILFSEVDLMIKIIINTSIVLITASIYYQLMNNEIINNNSNV
jgi:O-antigen/teichoic acid export membrane protein